jgi:hypothetical protein
MKIFLDDIRNAPEGWHRCYWPDEVIDLLKTKEVTHLSLDHDLGDDDKGTGYDVLKWLENAVYNGLVPLPEIEIHTANPAARKRMLAAVKSIYSHV